MKSTIDAMKMALDIISRTTSSAFVKTMLEEAIAREEAQTVEPCKGANCGTTNPKLHSAACFAQYESTIGAESPFGYFSFVLDDGDGYWREAEDGEGRPLFTHPAPTATAPAKTPENCGTGHCSCIECVKP